MLRRGKNAVKDPEKDSSDAGKITAEAIRSQYEKAYKSVRAETYNYWLNVSFLLGHQWVFWNTQTRRLDEIPRDPDRVQATINKVLPASRTIISKATSRDLRFDVLPSAADDATTRAARLSESILVDVHREHDWETIREDSVWATWRGGTSAICVEWDAEAGQAIEHDEEGRTVGTGDTVETVLNIAEFVVEPGARNAEKARWWIRAQTLPPTEVQAQYRLKEKPEADASAGMSPLQQRLLAEQGTNRDEQTDLTLVLTYYERPNHLRPKGTIATVVGEELVDGPHDWYFPWTEKLNIAVQRETHVDGRWAGETVLTQARPIQALFNQSWSSIVEHMKLAGNARLAVPQSSIDFIQTLTDEPGELLGYPDGTEQPKWVAPPQMPAWWIDQPDKLAAELDDTLGVHAVTRGEAPNNIQSGYGLSILSENDSTPLGRLVKETAITWGKVARMVLELVEAKVSETREAKVLTPGQAPETMNWKGKDLAGQTNAVIPIDAVMPRSRAAMQAFAEKAMQMGLIKTVAQFARVADFPQQADLIEAVSPDVSKARRENYQMALGHPCVPDVIDDHKVHIQEHQDMMKSAKYEVLKREDPDAAAIYVLHNKAHEVLAAEAAGALVARGTISPALAAAPNATGAPELGAEGGPAGPAPVEGPPPGLPPAGMDESGAALPSPTAEEPAPTPM